MAYSALYRKFRPETFEDVKGQDAIVTTLKNQVKSGMLSHAYLFCGTRGTGKTTIAKILAKAVNCENPQDGEPCGVCETCKAIAGARSMNVIEIDAASNNGVDDVRGIREEIEYPPTEGKYKVYIIDEVHMLSGAAFNALLKTLEEPPSYVIFILATTESHKIPATISSRCQKYSFKRISIETIVARLKELMDKEGRVVEEKALKYIAKAGDGSMRDSLSLLDRCLAFYVDENITYDMVLSCLGAVDSSVFYKLLEEVVDCNAVEAITSIAELINEGREPGQLLNDFIWYLRDLLLVDGGDGVQEVLDISTENLKVLKEQRSKIPSEKILRYIKELSETSDKLRTSSQKRVLLEVTFIKLMKPEMEQSSEAVNDRILELERKIEDGLTKANQVVQITHTQNEEEPEKEPPKLDRAVPEDVKKLVENYRRYIMDLEYALKASLNESKVSLSNNDNLLIVLRDQVAQGFVEKQKAIIEEHFSNKIGKEVKVEFSSVKPGSTYKRDFVDLEEYINTKVEIEDF